LSQAASLRREQTQADDPLVDATFSFDLPAGAFCDFAIRDEGSQKEKTIELPGGRTLLIFPGAVATLTNLSNGNQETFRIPGSFHITTQANGNVEIVFTVPTSSSTHSPGLSSRWAASALSSTRRQSDTATARQRAID
jgi:hypothetical protein